MIRKKIFDVEVDYLTQKDDDSLIQFLLIAVNNKVSDISNHWRFEELYIFAYLGTQITAVVVIGNKYILRRYFIEDREMIHYGRKWNNYHVKK